MAPRRPPRIAPPATDEPRLVPQARRGYFYFDTPEQKRLIEERARAANRTFSSYVLNTLLSSAGDVAQLEEQANRYREEAQQWRDDFHRERREREELAQRVLDLERTKQELMLEVERLREQADGPSELSFHDLRAWTVLRRHRDPETGAYEPVLERNLIIELDVVENPDFIRLLKGRLLRAAELGILEVVDVHGKRAYRWIGEGVTA